MASWIEIGQEISNTKTAKGAPDFDTVRRAKLAALEAHTGRPVILYASAFTHPVKAGNPKIQMDLDDKVAFKDVTEVLTGDAVDVLLFLPGGSAEATESIVDILRSKFKSVRFIIPHTAKSAATMLAMSGDCILLDHHSELGPIDPQFFMKRGEDVVIAPAQAIVEQFEQAQKLLAKEPDKLPAWIPILQQYGPALYQQAKHQSKLSVELVSKWLRTYMFVGAKTAKEKRQVSRKATSIAKWLNSHGKHLSHGRRISMADLQKCGVKVVDMMADPVLHERVWDIQYAIDHCFGATGAVKIVENAHGRCIARLMLVQQVAIPIQQLQAPTPQQAPPQLVQ